MVNILRNMSECSRKILLKIASTSNKVVAAANDYADRRDLLVVQGSHFQLEDNMRKISVACESCRQRRQNAPSRWPRSG